jgi:thiol-disulfide isomerase/thioredoxin
MRRSGRFAASFLSALLAIGCGAPPRPIDRGGRAVTPQVSGRPSTIVHFWATWCVPCREELPQLVAYARTHRIPLITVANDRSFDDVDRFLRERSLSVDVLLDRDGKFGRANHADKLPTTLIYDARGNVKERFTGAQDWRAYELNRR